MAEELVRFWMNEAVVSTTIDENVKDIAEVMTKQKIGSLVVVDSDEKPIGIITTTDIIEQIVAKNLLPQDLMVIDVMSTKLISVDVDTTMHDAAALMEDNHIKKLPVIDPEGKLKGMITTTDVNRYCARQ